jgi:hypothetical protein
MAAGAVELAHDWALTLGPVLLGSTQRLMPRLHRPAPADSILADAHGGIRAIVA